MTDLLDPPASAYPYASYREEETLTPRRVRADSTADGYLLYIGGQIIMTPRSADDTQLRASIALAREISQAAERHGSAMRAELELREVERARQAGLTQSGTPQGAHPYPGAVEPIDAEQCRAVVEETADVQ